MTQGRKKGVIGKKRNTYIKSNPQQLTFRLHKNDHAEFAAKLSKEQLKIPIQMFIEACVYAYLDDEEPMLNIVRAYASTCSVKRKNLDWSQREQRRLLDDIAKVLEADDDAGSVDHRGDSEERT